MRATGSDCAKGPGARGCVEWRKLTRQEGIAIAITLALLSVVGVWHLPPGACFDDAGDLQVACATLGIAHPPGYAGYTTVGWLLCKAFFFIEPAYVVSLACLGCMVTSLGVLAVLLVRLGLHVLAACSLTLILVAHHTPWQSSVWQSMVCPEVYAPSWALLVGTTYFLFKYGRLHRRRDLCVAAGLFGFLMVNRPPSALFGFGLVIGWLLIEGRRCSSVTDLFKRAGAALASAALPILIVLVLLWFRDTPSTAYNIIEQHSQVYGGLPDQTEGFDGRYRRLSWLVTAEVFQHLVIADLSHAPQKLRWIRRVLFVYDTGPFVGLCVVLLIGAWRLIRQGGEWMSCAVGVVLGNVAFLGLYNVHAQAANLLPLMFGIALLTGAVLSTVMPTHAGERSRSMAATLFILVSIWTVYHSATRYNYGDAYDATGFLDQVDLATLPRDAVICTVTQKACPLWYARIVTHWRPDVQIFAAVPHRWNELVQSALHRPVFYTNEHAAVPAGWRLVPDRNLWRLKPTLVDETS
ncbi:MAG: hypothetical protein V3W34_06835 [Phycisphaerae bacterium]